MLAIIIHFLSKRRSKIIGGNGFENCILINANVFKCLKIVIIGYGASDKINII